MVKFFAFSLCIVAASAPLTLACTLDPRVGLLLALLFSVVAGAGMIVRRPDGSMGDGAGRWVLALTLGWAATWFGVGFYVETWHYAPNTPLPEEWRRLHGATEDVFETFAVTGFPIQRIEGHGTGGGPGCLPWSKGGWALVSNLMILSALSGLLAWQLPRRAVKPVAWGAIVSGPIACWLAWWRLVALLD